MIERGRLFRLPLPRRPSSAMVLEEEPGEVDVFRPAAAQELGSAPTTPVHPTDGHPPRGRARLRER